MIYYFKLDTYGTLPLEFEIKRVETVDNGEGDMVNSYGENILKNHVSTNQIVTYDEAQHDYELTIHWTEEKNDYLYSFEIDQVKLNLISYQAVPEPIGAEPQGNGNSQEPGN